MESHDPNQPHRPDEEPTHERREPDGDPTEPTHEQMRPDEEPTEPTIESPAAAAPGGPRRLFRSRTDRVLGGVCGGLGRYLGVDPIILRIAFVVLLVFGGVSLLAYVVALLLVPNEPEGSLAGVPGAASVAAPDRNRILAIVGLVLLVIVGWPILLAIGGLAVPVALLALLGLGAWWLVSGEAPQGGAGDVARRSALGLAVLLGSLIVFAVGAWAAAAGGGAIAAGIVIAAGIALVAGAFAGRVRPLILPALALALGVGVVSAAGIDLDGGVGDRHYRPLSAAQLEPGYELGIGELVVDLRETNLPPGDTPLAMDLGMGQATVIVPPDVCVATTASVGMGNVHTFGRDDGGIDLEWEDLPQATADNSRLVVDANLGMGELRLRHDPLEAGDGGPPAFDRGGRPDDEDRPEGNTGCVPATSAMEPGA